ncbi:unnamed protein product [Pylaiella littoralis]
MLLVMWPWATPTATWTQTRRTSLGRHHHQRRKDGMETPSSTTSDDTFVFLCFFFFCLLRLPGLLGRCRQHSRQQLTAVVLQLPTGCLYSRLLVVSGAGGD